MIRYGIVQLSDLQFGHKHRFGNPSDIHQTLARDINHMAEKYNFMPIYLLLTGDIVETGHLDEFRDATESIKKLSDEIAIDRESILAIPGNHDMNWALSKIAKEVGDPMLKYNNFNKFAQNSCNQNSIINGEIYKQVFDHQLGIEFLLLNSCEFEDHENHFGFIDKEKLVKTLINQTEKTIDYLKICLCHHRLDSSEFVPNIHINNISEIQTILTQNNYHIVFTGHIHENKCIEVKENGRSIIHSGSGSAGVNSTEREDGLPNQYSIHVLDSFNKQLETYWRKFDPRARSKFGLGGWLADNSTEDNPFITVLPMIKNFDSFSSNNKNDISLIQKFNINSNPFTFKNAEKIKSDQLIHLFVSSEGRNKGAVRLTGDAIIRGSRGSGKTMLLRYLELFGNFELDNNIRNRRSSEVFPVMVNLSLIHSSEWKSDTESLIETAERLIFDSVLTALNKKSIELNSPEFRKACLGVKQKLAILKNQEGSDIAKLGEAINHNLSKYFSHVLLLIDEVASVFPKEFFNDANNGFLRWMNSIRNSGPYFTRLAVYPNDISDVLNEERFGAIVNLDYNIKSLEDYKSYRSYCIDMVNKYLSAVSIDRRSPCTIEKVIDIEENGENDAIEQLIYASDGSSRRFISLFDRCLTTEMSRHNNILNKELIFNIIKEFADNLLSSYSVSERELAQSLAKACRKQVTYRFRLPNNGNLVTNLHAKNEELNIVKLAEVGTGRRGTTYEFTYPYCILMDVQTHYLKETRSVCSSRDVVTGEWINQVTSITPEMIDSINQDSRAEGVITEIEKDSNIICITDLFGNEYLSESFNSSFKIGDKVTFIHIKDIASDITISSLQ
jgi:predicted phosphodiesterase